MGNDRRISCVWRDDRKGPACGVRANRPFNLCEGHYRKRVLAVDPGAGNYLPHNPQELCACETCGLPTPMLGTGRCDGCWELEGRLAGYLRRGGQKARDFVLSCLGAIALCFVLPGCGGAPFSFPPDGGIGSDSEMAIGDPGPDAGATPDAVAPLGDAAADAPSTSTPDATPPDAPSTLDAAPDASMACTTPLQTTPRDLCPAETANRVFPATYLKGGPPDAGDACQSIAGFFTTPGPCACAETFTCACLVANGAGAECVMVKGVPWIY